MVAPEARAGLWYALCVVPAQTRGQRGLQVPAVLSAARPGSEGQAMAGETIGLHVLTLGSCLGLQMLLCEMDTALELACCRCLLDSERRGGAKGLSLCQPFFL